MNAMFAVIRRDLLLVTRRKSEVLTALFFFVIACLLILFTILAIRFPETPRRGVLRIETTRGDRLFISLLGSAFVCIGWLFAFGGPLWGALILCLIYAAAVFRWV